MSAIKNKFHVGARFLCGSKKKYSERDYYLRQATTAQNINILKIYKKDRYRRVSRTMEIRFSRRPWIHIAVQKQAARMHYFVRTLSRARERAIRGTRGERIIPSDGRRARGLSYHLYIRFARVETARRQVITRCTFCCCTPHPPLMIARCSWKLHRRVAQRVACIRAAVWSFGGQNYARRRYRFLKRQNPTREENDD